MNIYRGIVDKEHLDPTTLKYVRNFILDVSKDLTTGWLGGRAGIQINSAIYRIENGSVYEKRDSDKVIYLYHNQGKSRPDWLTGVLSAIAQYYQIDQEPEIIEAIIKMAVDYSLNQFSSIPGAFLAQTFGGYEVEDIAIKMGSNLIAGLCKEGEAQVWRLKETGEVVYPAPDDGWISFSLKEGL